MPLVGPLVGPLVEHVESAATVLGASVVLLPHARWGSLRWLNQ